MFVRVVLPSPGSPMITITRGWRWRTSSQASRSTLNSRSRPMSISGSKRRCIVNGSPGAGGRVGERFPSRNRSAMRARSALGFAPSSSASRSS